MWMAELAAQSRQLRHPHQTAYEAPQALRSQENAYPKGGLSDIEEDISWLHGGKKPWLLPQASPD